jgi:LEA14-like dessication related protein
MIKRLHLLSILCFSLLLSACNWKEVKLEKIESFKVLSIDKEGMEVELNVLISNPNAVGFTIYDSDLNLTVSKIELGKIKLTDAVHVGAHGKSHKKIQVRTSLKDLGITALAGIAAIAAIKKIDISISGDVSVRTLLFLKKKYPVTLNEKISI